MHTEQHRRKLPSLDLLIFVDEARAAGADPRDLRRACVRGELVRVRRGVYCGSGTWANLDASARHVLAIRAVARNTHPPFLVAGESAGALWGLPFAAGWPDDVTLLVPGRGRGTSEPGVRRTTISAASAAADVLGGISVTTLARTALDMARPRSFPHAVAILDGALSQAGTVRTTREELSQQLHNARYVRRGAHLARTLAFATGLSGSVYESMARAVMHELGFAPPILQAEITDEEGRMYPDFLWPEQGIAAEFDGKVKYTRPEFTGADPSEVVWREKRREDRLRRRGIRTVVRILAEHVHDRDRLAQLLHQAGVPRQRPGYDASAPGVRGAVAPEREQWPTGSAG